MKLRYSFDLELILGLDVEQQKAINTVKSMLDTILIKELKKYGIIKKSDEDDLNSEFKIIA